MAWQTALKVGGGLIYRRNGGVARLERCRVKAQAFCPTKLHEIWLTGIRKYCLVAGSRNYWSGILSKDIITDPIALLDGEEITNERHYAEQRAEVIHSSGCPPVCRANPNDQTVRTNKNDRVRPQMMAAE